jgi:hypothetical protein
MTHAQVQDWLDRYVAAWQSYDEAAIRDLFSADAEYRYHPWDEPVRGVDAIVDDWLNPGGKPESRDRPGTWWAHYEPAVVEGSTAVVVGETKYFADASQVVLERHYYNIWPLEFDAVGRCRSFTEWFMLRKKES